jgi:hypothetical protein
MQTDITSKGLRDSEEDHSEPQRFKLCHGIGVTTTKSITCRKSEQTLRQQDARRAADCWPPQEGGKVWVHPHVSIPPPKLE